MKKKTYLITKMLIIALCLTVIMSEKVCAASKPKVPKVTTEAYTSKKNISISWKKIKKASGYEVYMKEKGERYKKVKTTKATSYKRKNVKSDKTYFFKVRAYKNINGKKIYGNFSTVKKVKVAFRPKDPDIISVESLKSGIKIEWKEVSHAKGYEVYVKENNGNYIKAGTTSGTSYTKTNITPGFKYSFKIRAYNQYGRTVYGNYSAEKSIQIPSYQPKTPEIISVQRLQTGIEVKWNAVAYAKGYEVYVKENSGSYVKAGQISGTNYMKTDISPGSRYSFKVRAFNQYGQTVYSNYSSEKSIQIPSYVYLTDVLDPFGGTAWYREDERNTFWMGGMPYSHGIRVSKSGSILYNLNGDYQRIKFTFGGLFAEFDAKVVLYGDDVLIGEAEYQALDLPKTYEFQINKCNKLEIYVDCAYRGNQRIVGLGEIQLYY